MSDHHHKDGAPHLASEMWDSRHEFTPQPEPEGHAFTRAVKAARTARFRSAEGRSEGAAVATELLGGA